MPHPESFFLQKTVVERAIEQWEYIKVHMHSVHWDHITISHKKKDGLHTEKFCSSNNENIWAFELPTHLTNKSWFR